MSSSLHFVAFQYPLPFLRYARPKNETMLSAIIRNQLVTPSIIIREHDGVIILLGLKCRKGQQISNLTRMLGRYHRYKRSKNPNLLRTSLSCMFGP